MEERSLQFSDMILMNSKYTQQICREHYPSLAKVKQDILYPAIELDKFELKDKDNKQEQECGSKYNYRYILSVNRYERKKNIRLAIHAFSEYLGMADCDGNIKLIIAGGYDLKLQENVEHCKELKELCCRLNLEDRVVFLQNISDTVRAYLMRNSVCVLYTPQNEHFGIVPLEVMYSRAIVICHNSGGPKESVLNAHTGFLIDSLDSLQWAQIIAHVIKQPSQFKLQIGRQA